MSADPKPPFAAASGWFHLVDIAALDGGRVAERAWMGTQVAAFLGADGHPRVVQAHCPHLGASFARGGRIDGDALTCPFHNWRFDGADGRLLDVPYSDRKPPRICLARWPAARVGEHVFAHHAPASGDGDLAQLGGRRFPTPHAAEQAPPAPHLPELERRREVAPIGPRTTLRVRVPASEALRDPERMVEALRAALGDRVGSPPMRALPSPDGAPRWRVQFAIEPDGKRRWAKTLGLVLSGPSDIEVMGPGLIVAQAVLERPVRRRFTTLLMPVAGAEPDTVEVGVQIYMHMALGKLWPVDLLVRRGARAIASSVVRAGDGGGVAA